MKHHIRKSEYQRQFSPIDDDYFTANYMEQLDYRTKRREKENNGNMIFKWESESDMDTDSVSNNEENQNEGEEEIAKRLSGDENVDPTSDKCEKELSKSKASQTSDQEEPTKPDTTKTVTRSRSKSRGKTPTVRVQSVEKPPFMSYGWADEQVTTGRKRTHNVQAPKKTVYPAALQRKSYLVSEKKKQKQKLLERASSALANIPALKKISDSSEWQTEYQRCYSSLSSRPGTAQSKASKKSGRKSRLSTKRKVLKP